MKPAVEAVELDFQQLERLLDQIEQALGEQTARPFRILLSGYLAVLRLLEQKNITLRRLRRLLLGSSTERTRNVVLSDEPHPEGAQAEEDGQEGANSEAGSSERDPSSDSDSSPSSDSDSSPSNNSDSSPSNNSDSSPSNNSGDGATANRRRPGHGRIPASAYIGCLARVITHQSFSPGDACPHCQEGTLYRQGAWAQVIRLIGQPPVTGVRYELERLRCNLCGAIQTAELPEEAPEEAGEDKYDASVASVLATLRYGLGMPFTRIEQMQRWAGVPLPWSTQWELVRDAVEQGIGAVYRQLILEAAQGQLFHSDDTSMQILELTAQLEKGLPLRDDAPDRTGVYTTSILSLAEGRPVIALFFTGPWHSGENLRQVLESRLGGLPPPLQMCDALSRNMPADLKTIVANCLAHARRNFYDLAEVFPSEVRHVLECLKQVYQIDAQAKSQGLSPEERLRLHQQHSGPVMEQLQQWLNRQLDERLVEPNSSLGQAISYMLRHWEKLTRFLHEAGAPLDNNICERALKMAIRHRKNSLFYKTQTGAEVGDMYMTLIHTCSFSGVDPIAYLTALQRHCQRVIASPAQWFPWNYHEQLTASA